MKRNYKKETTVETTQVFNTEYNQYTIVHLEDEHSIDTINKFGAQEYSLWGVPFALDGEYYVFMEQKSTIASLPLEYVKNCILAMIEANKPKRLFGARVANTNPNSEIVIDTLVKLAEMLQLDLGE